MTVARINLTPIKPGVAAVGGRLAVLVRLTGPARKAGAPRPPRDLALVVDRSGSMSGKPLEEAKACALRIVEALEDRDHVTIVAYDDQVEVVLERMPGVAARSQAKGRLARIESRGMTALHAGWLAGADQIAGFVGPDRLSRVILLSDGQANRGVTEPENIADQAREMAEAGVSTSTIGLGNDFNEALMVALAKGGRGNPHYGETVADLWPSFQAEFGLIDQTVGKGVALTIRAPANGTVVCKNAYARDASGAVMLPDLVADSDSWALLEISLPALSEGAEHQLAVTARWTRIEDGAAETLEGALAIPVVAEAALAAMPEDPTIVERRRELEAAELQLEAMRHAKAGDWTGTQAAITRMRAMAGDNAYVIASADTLAAMAAQNDAALVGKQALYAAASMSTRYAKAGEDHKVLDEVRRARQGRHADADRNAAQVVTPIAAAPVQPAAPTTPTAKSVSSRPRPPAPAAASATPARPDTGTRVVAPEIKDVLDKARRRRR